MHGVQFFFLAFFWGGRVGAITNCNDSAPMGIAKWSFPVRAAISTWFPFKGVDKQKLIPFLLLQMCMKALHVGVSIGFHPEEEGRKMFIRSSSKEGHIYQQAPVVISFDIAILLLVAREGGFVYRCLFIRP